MRMIQARILVSFVLLASMVSIAEASSPHCSRKTAVGSWAFTVTGNIPAIGPAASVGTFTADASGNLSGKQTRSLNGQIADETLSGTYTVTADCTGTDVIQVFESGILVRTSTLKVIYDENGRGARAIFSLVVLPNGDELPTILTVDAKRIFSSE